MNDKYEFTAETMIAPDGQRLRRIRRRGDGALGGADSA